MGRSKLKWNLGGFEQIRRSPQAVELLTDKVNEWLAMAGGEAAGYRAGVVQGKPRGTRGRAIGTLVAYTKRAQRDNARNHTLVRIIGGGGPR